MRRSTAFYVDALRIAVQSIFAHKLGRVVYHLLRTKKVFDVDRFVRH